MAIVTPADMKKFRADNYVIPIDELSDLNTTTKEAIDILNRIKALDVKGENMLVVIPDNGVICATQVRHRIEKMISPQTKELVDNCVAIHLDDRSLELNVIAIFFHTFSMNIVNKRVFFCSFRQTSLAV